MSAVPSPHEAAVGDWLEEPAVGGAPRRGLVLEVLGRPGHRHYRVRWDEEHETLHFLSPRARIVPPAGGQAGGQGR